MANFNPFKPAESSIDPLMFLSSQSTQGPMNEDEKLMQYLESQGIKPSSSTPDEVAGSGSIGSAGVLAGTKAVANIAEEIGKAQQFKAKQEQDIMAGEGQSRQGALSRAGASKFRSLAELIQNYRSAIR